MRNLASYDVDIACLSETRLPNSGSRVIKVLMGDKEYRLYHSGPTDNSSLSGVAIAMNQVASNTLLQWEPISPRIAVARFAGKPFNLTLIAVYAPTVPSATADKDAFYYQLQDVVSRVTRKDIVMLAGDWNAQVGQPDEEIRHLIGLIPNENGI